MQLMDYIDQSYDTSLILGAGVGGIGIVVVVKVEKKKQKKSSPMRYMTERERDQNS